MKRFISLFCASTLSVISLFAGSLIPSKDSKTGLWGYVDSDNCTKFVIKPAFAAAYPFSEGLAVVMSEGYYGYINTKGLFVILPQYDQCGDFTDGLALCCTNSRYGIIDKTNKIIVPFDYKKIVNADYINFGLRADGACDIITIGDSQANVYHYTSVDRTIVKPLGFRATSGSQELYLDSRTGMPAYNVQEPYSLHSDYQVLCRASGNQDPLIFMKSNKELTQYKSLSEIRSTGAREAVNSNGIKVILNKKGQVAARNASFVGDCILQGSTLSEAEGAQIFSGVQATVDGTIVRIYDKTKTHLYCFDTEANRQGLTINGKDCFMGDRGGIISFVTTSSGKEITLSEVGGDEHYAYDSAGNRLWEDYRINNVKNYTIPDTDTKICLLETSTYNYVIGKNYKLSDVALDDIRYSGSCTLITADNEKRYGAITLIDGMPAVLGNDFNYNTYTWYYDFNSQLYGFIEKSGDVIRPAYSKQALNVPRGNTWLWDSYFYNKQVGNGLTRESVLYFEKGYYDYQEYYMVTVYTRVSGNTSHTSTNRFLVEPKADRLILTTSSGKKTLILDSEDFGMWDTAKSGPYFKKINSLPYYF